MATNYYDDSFPLSISITVDYRHKQTESYHHLLRISRAAGRDGIGAHGARKNGGLFSSAFFLLYSMAWRVFGFLDASFVGRRTRVLLGRLIERPADTTTTTCAVGAGLKLLDIPSIVGR